MNDVERLAELWRKLGAPAAQAETMARQLLKRADQLAVERGQSREVALEYLLRIAVQGREGAVAPEFRPPGSEQL